MRRAIRIRETDRRHVEPVVNAYNGYTQRFQSNRKTSCDVALAARINTRHRHEHCSRCRNVSAPFGDASCHRPHASLIDAQMRLPLELIGRRCIRSNLLPPSMDPLSSCPRTIFILADRMRPAHLARNLRPSARLFCDAKRRVGMAAYRQKSQQAVLRLLPI
jgi:hypothetical protein